MRRGSRVRSSPARAGFMAIGGGAVLVLATLPAATSAAAFPEVANFCNGWSTDAAGVVVASSYRRFTFTSDGTFTTPNTTAMPVKLFMVGGGGGGGAGGLGAGGGGGGAGAVMEYLDTAGLPRARHDLHDHNRPRWRRSDSSRSAGSLGPRRRSPVDPNTSRPRAGAEVRRVTRQSGPARRARSTPACTPAAAAAGARATTPRPMRAGRAPLAIHSRRKWRTWPGGQRCPAQSSQRRRWRRSGPDQRRQRVERAALAAAAAAESRTATRRARACRMRAAVAAAAAPPVEAAAAVAASGRREHRERNRREHHGQHGGRWRWRWRQQLINGADPRRGGCARHRRHRP